MFGSEVQVGSMVNGWLAKNAAGDCEVRVSIRGDNIVVLFECEKNKYT